MASLSDPTESRKAFSYPWRQRAADAWKVEQEYQMKLTRDRERAEQEQQDRERNEQFRQLATALVRVFGLQPNEPAPPITFAPVSGQAIVDVDGAVFSLGYASGSLRLWRRCSCGEYIGSPDLRTLADVGRVLETWQYGDEDDEYAHDHRPAPRNPTRLSRWLRWFEWGRIRR